MQQQFYPQTPKQRQSEYAIWDNQSYIPPSSNIALQGKFAVPNNRSKSNDSVDRTAQHDVSSKQPEQEAVQDDSRTQLQEPLPFLDLGDISPIGEYDPYIDYFLQHGYFPPRGSLPEPTYNEQQDIPPTLDESSPEHVSNIPSLDDTQSSANQTPLSATGPRTGGQTSETKQTTRDVAEPSIQSGSSTSKRKGTIQDAVSSKPKRRAVTSKGTETSTRKSKAKAPKQTVQPQSVVYSIPRDIPATTSNASINDQEHPASVEAAGPKNIHPTGRRYFRENAHY